MITTTLAVMTVNHVPKPLSRPDYFSGLLEGAADPRSPRIRSDQWRKSGAASDQCRAFDTVRSPFTAASLHEHRVDCTFPFPRQAYPMRCVSGVRKAVNRFRIAALIRRSATWRSKPRDMTRSSDTFSSSG